jgi:hypothetical protein
VKSSAEVHAADRGRPCLPPQPPDPSEQLDAFGSYEPFDDPSASDPCEAERTIECAGGLVYPTPDAFPVIDEVSLATVPCDSSHIAVALGLDLASLTACARAVGDTFSIVGTQDAAAASDLLAVLRPQLVVVLTPELQASFGRQLTAVAMSRGTQLVCVGAHATSDAIFQLVRRSATTVEASAEQHATEPAPVGGAPEEVT